MLRTVISTTHVMLTNIITHVFYVKVVYRKVVWELDFSKELESSKLDFWELRKAIAKKFRFISEMGQRLKKVLLFFCAARFCWDCFSCYMSVRGKDSIISETSRHSEKIVQERTRWNLAYRGNRIRHRTGQKKQLNTIEQTQWSTTTIQQQQRKEQDVKLTTRQNKLPHEITACLGHKNDIIQ